MVLLPLFSASKESQKRHREAGYSRALWWFNWHGFDKELLNVNQKVHIKSHLQTFWWLLMTTLPNAFDLEGTGKGIFNWKLKETTNVLCTQRNLGDFSLLVSWLVCFPFKRCIKQSPLPRCMLMWGWRCKKGVTKDASGQRCAFGWWAHICLDLKHPNFPKRNSASFMWLTAWFITCVGQWDCLEAAIVMIKPVQRSQQRMPQCSKSSCETPGIHSSCYQLRSPISKSAWEIYGTLWPRLPWPLFSSLHLGKAFLEAFSFFLICNFMFT